MSVNRRLGLEVEEEGVTVRRKEVFVHVKSLIRSTPKYKDGFILALYTIDAHLEQGINDARLAMSTDYTTPSNATLPYYSTLEYLGP